MQLRPCVRLLIAFLILFSSVVSAQQKWPNTLLWKISGNGLSKPSFLFGTMHLQDKRLFQFGDSLYQSLSEVEGFALEVDFKEYLDSMLGKQIDEAQDNMLANQEVKIDRKKLDRTSDSILKQFGIKDNKISKKELRKIRDYRMNKMVQKGEMQTIVDVYL
jgi:uncharacterized protein YbaP (TraB family)